MGQKTLYHKTLFIIFDIFKHILYPYSSVLNIFNIKHMSNI